MNNTLEKRSLSDILQKYGALLTLILVVLALAIISPDFRTMDNFMKLLRQASVNGLIAFGMTAVILTGFHQQRKTRQPQHPRQTIRRRRQSLILRRTRLGGKPLTQPIVDRSRTHAEHKFSVCARRLDMLP